MQLNISLKLLPSEASDESLIRDYLAQVAGRKPADVSGFHILKRSIDARAKTTWINLTCRAFINEPFAKREIKSVEFKDVRQSSKRVIIIGAGPAGLFAAMKLLEHGVKPVILERGKDVRSRRRDLAQLNKEGSIDPESNYCFGEGGAGTYSDGKLYTRAKDREGVADVLGDLVRFGAPADVEVEARPHVGSNRLPRVLQALRAHLTGLGVEYRFETTVAGLRAE